MSELSRIPNVGKATERDLNEMGYTTVESLKGKTGEDLYAQECAMRGVALDRCQLYLLRAVEYFVNTENPDPEKCKWWYWKDEFVEPSPCGTVCVQCGHYPAECKGCRKIKGKVYWLAYAGLDGCPIYDCCVSEKGNKNCASCENLPCVRYMKDPSISDEENAENLKIMLNNLKNSVK